ncbi:MAG: hypothetical protein FGM36_15595 [Burkholderiaceae bacterium]|nr:hypothetical protein [Burkholderiaceae bacterium]
MSNNTNTTGVIKMGKHTSGHKASLEKAGYKVTEENGHLQVEVTGFVQNLDLSQGKEALRDIVANRQALSYSTRVLFSDGKSLFGVPACTRLGELSFLIMKPQKGEKVKVEAEFSLDDIL